MKKTYIKPEFEINVVELHTLMGVDASGNINGGSGGTLPSGGEGSDDPENPDDADVVRTSLWDE